MLALSSLFNKKSIALFAFALFALFTSFTSMPARVHAAAVTLTTATTTSNNASTTLAKIGNTVSYQLVLSGTPSATSTPVINIFGLGTTSMSGSGTNWTYSTTTSSAWTNGFIAFTMAWGGSVGESTTTITQTSLTGPNVRFDKASPVITSITSTATTTGALKVGSTIAFTLTPSSTEYGGSVTGSYNATPLTWTTVNGGATFVATSTVTEGQTDQATPLQISGVTLSDAAGNAVTASGSDILKTIDAHSPATPTASLAAGSYSGSQTTTLSSTGADTIFYSLGSSPTCSVGTQYSGPLTIGSSETLQVIGCDAAGNTSSVASFAYTINPIIVRSTGSGGSHGGNRAYAPTSVSVPTTTVAPTTVSVPAVVPVPSSSSMSMSFARNLHMGSTGSDVKMLQVFLNTHGFPVALTGDGSTGNEMTTFGARTKAALAKFQTAKGITPASGYFGTKTRTLVSGM